DCNENNDCVGNDCNNQCVANCADQEKNQDETDVDCGGNVCNSCADGKACVNGGDCASQVCVNNVCAVPACNDNAKNQDETDTDCGGNVCNGCADGDACNGDSDCLNFCKGNTCQSCGPLMNPISDGGNADNPLAPIIMSEISPGNFIELYNSTNNDIVLNNTVSVFCSPFSYVDLSMAGAGVTVPANGYATIPFPAMFTANGDKDSGGEIILYKSGMFGMSKDVDDFVCWGVNPHGSRKATAEASGKWVGNCAAAMQNSSIRRVPGSKGASAADYDATVQADASNCTP
ncbi:hypothetical protein JYT22_01315, partial [Endomicrobium sp. AH-315-J14]|nr:hypothetical protein [Endomicrobium sp. AH-315-J14]